MSKGYFIFTEEIHDQEALSAYTMAAMPSVIAAGGTVLIAGPPDHIPEGNWTATRPSSSSSKASRRPALGMMEPRTKRSSGSGIMQPPATWPSSQRSNSAWPLSSLNMPPTTSLSDLLNEARIAVLACRMANGPPSRALVCRLGRPLGYGVSRVAGWNNSTGLPDGSSSTTCEPPGPVMTSLRNVMPAAVSRWTSVSMSSTMRCIRFHPPATG
jgi:Domain of unknown function (DUF1330)